MVAVNGLERYHEKVQLAKLRAQGKITAHYHKLVTNVLKDLSQHTPQWSGDLAASWQVVVGARSVGISSNTTSLKVHPWQALVRHPNHMGDPEALAYALDANSQAIESIRWNSKVSIVNTNPTQYKLSEPELRDGNFVPGDIMWTAHAVLKYKFLGGV